MIFLDSDVIIEILDNNSSRGDQAIDIINDMEQPNLVISALVFEEVLFGIFKYQDQNQLPPSHPLNQFPVINFSKNDATIAAQIEIDMEKKGNKKPRGDIMIAATAITHNGKLFTFNKSHFEGIPDLQLIE